MDCNLKGLYESREWRRKNLTGYLAFNDGTELSDSQVRKVVRCALSAGLTKASQLDDNVVKMWLNINSDKPLEKDENGIIKKYVPMNPEYFLKGEEMKKNFKSE